MPTVTTRSWRSPGSTEGGDKLDAYTTVSSLQQLILVSSKRRHVELYSREADGSFRRTALSGAGTLELASLSVALPLTEVYQGTDDLMAPPP